jgi:ABC-type glutathione transport system ATPase component
MKPLLNIVGLHVTFSSWWSRRRVDAVVDAHLRVDPGESVGLVGESGCGKSTLVATALGTVSATGGTIELLGAPLTHRVGHRRGPRPEDVQAVFQSVDAHLDPSWTPAALLAETASRFGRTDAHITEVLEAVGLSHRRTVRAGRLSGGERRRLGLARVLLVRPKLILADEPCAGVDAGRRVSLVRQLQANRPTGSGLLLVSHDLHLVRETCHRVYVMLGGHIIETLPCDQLGRVPHHPYTDTLLRASGLRAGPVPPLTARPGPGCPVAHTCPSAAPTCQSEPPRLQPRASTTQLALACPHPIPPEPVR